MLTTGYVHPSHWMWFRSQPADWTNTVNRRRPAINTTPKSRLYVKRGTCHVTLTWFTSSQSNLPTYVSRVKCVIIFFVFLRRYFTDEQGSLLQENVLYEYYAPIIMLWHGLSINCHRIGQVRRFISWNREKHWCMPKRLENKTPYFRPTLKHAIVRTNNLH